MSDGNDLAEAMSGLDGFRVLDIAETADELTITVETTTATSVGRSPHHGSEQIRDRDSRRTHHEAVRDEITRVITTLP